MPNMSYCRFENTLSALQDCYNHLDDPKKELSDFEKRAKKRLIELCKDIAKEYDMGVHD